MLTSRHAENIPPAGHSLAESIAAVGGLRLVRGVSVATPCSGEARRYYMGKRLPTVEEGQRLMELRRDIAADDMEADVIAAWRSDGADGALRCLRELAAAGRLVDMTQRHGVRVATRRHDRDPWTREIVATWHPERGSFDSVAAAAQHLTR